MVEMENAEVLADPFALPIPTYVPRRYQTGSRCNWCGHIAFENDLIAQSRPGLLVQVGFNESDSYFGLCQSILNNSVDCVCYAVGQDSSPEDSSYNHRYYNGFSYLLNASLDEAQRQFSDNSIDVLRIEDSRTYAAARRNFESWLPKVKPGGIIILPDIVVRRADFGVWKFWEELQESCPQTFSFHHSGGLGLLRKPGGHSRNSRLVDLLFNSPETVTDQIRCHYALYAAYLETLLEDESPRRAQTAPPESRSSSDDILFRVSSVSEAGETASAKVEVGTWNEVSIDLGPRPLDASLGFSPANTICLVEIKTVEFFDLETGRVVGRLETPDDFEQLIPQGDVLVLPPAEGFQLFCFGSNPTLQFDPGLRFPGALRIQVCLRVDRELTRVAELLQRAAQPPITGVIKECELDLLQSQLAAAEQRDRQLESQCNQLTVENAAAQVLIKQLEHLLKEASQQIEKYKETASQSEWAVNREKERANAALRGLERCMTTIQAIEDSISWRLTAPLRFLLKVCRIGGAK